MNKKMIAALGLCLCSIASFAFADVGDWKYPLGKDVSSRFAGTVYRNDLIDLDPTYNVPQTIVFPLSRAAAAPGMYTAAWWSWDWMASVCCRLTGSLL